MSPYDTRAETADFERVFAESTVPLFRLAWSLCWDAHLAEDVVQTVFADAYRNWSSVGRLGRPDLWLRRAVINRCANLRRDRQRESAKAQRAGAEPTLHSVADAATGDRGLERIEAGSREVLAEVAKLPELQRVSVLLHYFDDLSVDAIAEVLEVHPGTIKTSLSRARHRLAVALAPIAPPATSHTQAPNPGGAR